MISVESISPTIVNTVCALRRGMLRAPSLKITGRRQAIHPTVSRQITSNATSATMIVVSDMPNSSVIGTPPRSRELGVGRTEFVLSPSGLSRVSHGLQPLARTEFIHSLRDRELRRTPYSYFPTPYFVVIDHDAVAHAHDPVALLADAAVVGDEDEREALLAIERFQQIDDFLGG